MTMNLEKYMLPCLSKTLFGLECLGCGFQRSLLLLLKGEISESFEMYPAIFTSILFLLSLSFHLFFKRIFSQKKVLIIGMSNVIFMIAGYVYKHY
jgi:hypothetical protein